MHVRRVATGHDEQGRAVVTDDSLVSASTPPLMPGMGFHSLWHRAATPTFPDAGRPDAGGAYFPPPGGLRWLVFTVPAERLPPPPGTDLATARAETETLLPGLLGTMEPEHPGMHRSPTIDFVYVLEGEIVLELDAGREVTLRCGDTAVQNGTRHAWRNRSGKTCRLLVVMAGAHTSG